MSQRRIVLCCMFLITAYPHAARAQENSINAKVATAYPYTDTAAIDVLVTHKAGEILDVSDLTVDGNPARQGITSFCYESEQDFICRLRPFEHGTQHTIGFRGLTAQVQMTDGNHELTFDPVTGKEECWSLVLNYNHLGMTNPELKIREQADGLPLLQPSSKFFPFPQPMTFKDDGSQPRYNETWGHTSNKFFTSLGTPQYLRFYGATSHHPRIMHFKTNHAPLLKYFAQGGAFTVKNFNSSYFKYEDHTAKLPGAADSMCENKGNYAMTEAPFWLGGQYHWQIKGAIEGQNGVPQHPYSTSCQYPTCHCRWEVDDYSVEYTPGSTYYAIFNGPVCQWYQYSTRHRIFFNEKDVTKCGKTRQTVQDRKLYQQTIGFASEKMLVASPPPAMIGFPGCTAPPPRPMVVQPVRRSPPPPIAYPYIPDSSSQQSSSSDSNGWMIGVGIVAGVVLVLLVGMVVHHNSKKRNQSAAAAAPPAPTAPTATVTTVPPPSHKMAEITVAYTSKALASTSRGEDCVERDNPVWGLPAENC